MPFGHASRLSAHTYVVINKQLAGYVACGVFPTVKSAPDGVDGVLPSAGMKPNLIKASAAFFALTTAGLLAYTTVGAQVNTNTFRVQDIRYDESMGTKLPLPTFPKSWKLISVSNGEKGNTNTLWFQAADGNIYMMSGFTTYGKFIIDNAVGKLNAR